MERNQALPHGGGAPPTAPRLTNEQLRLLALCVKIGKAQALHSETDAGRIQSLLSRNDRVAAIQAMASLLVFHGLDISKKRYPLDPERFKSHREIADLTQASLADRLTVSKEQISHYENGRSGISLESLLLVLSIFGVHASELLREK